MFICQMLYCNVFTFTNVVLENQVICRKTKVKLKLTKDRNIVLFLISLCTTRKNTTEKTPHQKGTE